MTDPITVETYVPVLPEAAWDAYTDPDAITRWNFATPEWCCTGVEVDLRPGGLHVARMEARDGSMGFDFAGTYKAVDPPHRLVLELDDGWKARVTFEADGGGTRVRTAFDPEASSPAEMQRGGWQAILDSYARYVRDGGAA